MGHRIGYLRANYDADVAMWDSHPLSLGATPTQVFIDGIPQLSAPFVVSKPAELQKEPKAPKWDKEVKEVLKHDGLPPLDGGKKVKEVIAFVNVNEVFGKGEGGVKSLFTASATGSPSIVIVENGKIKCMGTQTSCSVDLSSLSADSVIDLEGGSIAPGLTTYGAGIGLVEIGPETSTNDGSIFDPIRAGGNVPDLLKGVEIQAVDGLQFGGRNTL